MEVKVINNDKARAIILIYYISKFNTNMMWLLFKIYVYKNSYYSRLRCFKFNKKYITYSHSNYILTNDSVVII